MASLQEIMQRARQAWEDSERRTDVQLSLREAPMQSGTLRYADESKVTWEFIEHVPYEPSSYQWDAGIIVQVGENCYFISTMTGDVYGQTDERWWDDGGSLTRLIEDARCPEIDAQIERELERDRKMWGAV